MVMYKIKFRPTKNMMSLAKYGSKRFVKGKTYEIKRKLDRSQISLLRSKSGQRLVGAKTLSIRRC